MAVALNIWFTGLFPAYLLRGSPVSTQAQGIICLQNPVSKKHLSCIGSPLDTIIKDTTGVKSRQGLLNRSVLRNNLQSSLSLLIKKCPPCFFTPASSVEVH